MILHSNHKNRETVDLLQLAKDVIKEQKVTLLQKKLDISLSANVEIPTIQANLKSLHMVMQNILSNSIKYTPEKGAVKIRFSIVKDKDILIKISDNGYGIPKAQQDKIFTKFFRADNVRLKSTEGTGLGLYIVKLIIDNYGGRIRFESEEDKGDYSPMACKYGECIQWDGSNLTHGNELNVTGKTRVSMDFRIMLDANYIPSEGGSINTKTLFVKGGYYKI